MIECTNLVKTYQHKPNLVYAVDGVTCSIQDGEFVLIGGRSGSGKTTLLSMIGGLTRPTQGTVRFNGSDIWANSDSKLSKFRAEEIGFVFQFSGLISALTVIENVMMPTIFTDKKGARKKAEELLHYVGLESKINFYPSELSGGEIKRTAIARAIINKPKILLADEPTGDLDGDTEKEVMELFKKINLKGATTIIMVTHDLELAVYATQFIRMDKGKIAVDRLS